MRGFILAAGFGTRLRPLTEHVPKALVTVCGKPLISRTLDFLLKNGITTTGVNSHYLSEELERFGRESGKGFELFHEQGQIRGTGGGLYFAKEFLAGDDLFVVMNVDIVCEMDIGGLIQQFQRSPSVCGLVAFGADAGKGTILYDRDSGMFKGIPSETVKTGQECDASFTGIAIYKREFLSLLESNDFSIVPVWSRAQKKGMGVEVLLTENGWWKDIGTPQSLAEIHFAALDQRIMIDIPSYLRVDTARKCCYPYKSGNEVSGTYAWVEVEGIAPNCSISRSVVFEGAEVAGKTEIRNSLLTPWGSIRINEQC